MKTSDKLPPSLAAIAHELQNSSSFFLAVHQNPDGDTLGCALCLQSVLERQGKTAFVFSTDPLPKYLSFLQGYDRVSVGVLPQGKHFDTAVMGIVALCGSMGRAKMRISSCRQFVGLQNVCKFTEYPRNIFTHKTFIYSVLSLR